MIRLSGVLVLLLSNFSHAVENPHVLGADYSIGDIDYSAKKTQLRDSTTGHYGLWYQYKVNEEMTIGGKYINGDSDRSSFILIDIFSKGKFEYEAIMLSGAYQYKIPSFGALYAEVYVLGYDYDVIVDKEKESDDSGTDFGYSLGWQANFDNNISFKIGYEFYNFGNHAEIEGLHTGLSYRF